MMSFLQAQTLCLNKLECNEFRLLLTFKANKFNEAENK